jgi:8-oxo-dGTP pyrophosphatase MutT (NUDIX family)
MPKIEPWQVLSTQLIHQTPWINVLSDECQHGEKKFNYTYVERRDEGPVIIAEDQDQKLWLVQQYRHPIRKIVWQFPAEGKKPDESWEAAAQRGLQEELGKQAGKLIDLTTTYIDPGLLSQKTHIFLATDLHNVQVEKFHASEEEVEELNIQSFSLKEIEELIHRGEFCDNWGFAALYWYQKYQQK